MKRFMILALLAAFILGTVGVASAAELKVRGDWRVHFNYLKNTDFNQNIPGFPDQKHDKFSAEQRVRLIFEFIANENLKGVMQLQTAAIRWGHDDRDDLGRINRATNIVTRQAFLEFLVPNTKVNVKAGYQPIALPSTLGSSILDARAGALVASSPITDNVSLTLGWARALDVMSDNPAPILPNDEADVFFGVVPMTFDGVELNPFVVMSRWGKDLPVAGVTRDKNSTMWHLGLNFGVTMFDPIAILGDINYGSVDWGRDDTFIPGGLEQSGWTMLLVAQYAMDMVTPQIWFGYETGEKSDTPANIAAGNPIKSNRMPAILADGDFGPTVGFGDKTNFANSNFVRDALADLDPMDNGLESQAQGAVGMWHVGFALRDIQFMDKLSHELIYLYALGTNHKNNFLLFTTEDSYHEVNFNTTYQLYENLALMLELGYGKLKLDNLDHLGLVDLGITRSDYARSAFTSGVLGLRYRF